MSLLKINKEVKHKVAHIIAGLVILVHAYEKYELHEPSYLFFLLAGILFVSIALLHHRLLHRFPYADGFFFIIESVVYAVIAADYFHAGKKALPWCYVVVAILYVVAGFVKGKKGKEKHLNATKSNK